MGFSRSCLTFWFSALIILAAACGGGGGGGDSGPDARLTADPGLFQAVLSWEPVYGAVGYNLYWDTSLGVDTSANKIAGATSPHTHSGISPVRVYSYVLTMIDGDGFEHVVSREVHVQPLVPGLNRRLTASDAAFDHRLGQSVSINGDTAVAGAPRDGAGGSNAGAAYIYGRHEGGTDAWGETMKLAASDAQADDQFGTSVAVSGDYAVVGAYQEDSGGDNAGAAYVFYRHQGGDDNWGQVKKLTASDAQAGDGFGKSVSMSGAIVIVGAEGDDDGGNQAGAAYVFSRDQGGPDNWGQVKKLAASDAETGDVFGRSVAVDGHGAVVGASGENGSAGAAYIFNRYQGGEDNWGQVRKVTAADAQAVDYFGQSVSISGDTVLVGAWAADTVAGTSGAAYIFHRYQGGADNWGQVKKLTASDRQSSDWFGYSVSLSGDMAVIGAYGEDSSGSGAGAAYVFKRDLGGADNWGEARKLVAPDGAAGDRYGLSVSADGNFALVGADLDDTTTMDAGSAYLTLVYPYRNALYASDAEADDLFGKQVSVDGEYAIVGAPQEDTMGADAGAAYIFHRHQGGANNWGQVRKILAADAAAGDGFGHSVSISGDHAVVGARNDNGAKGAAYVFSRNLGGADNWGLIRKLTAGDGQADDYFGSAVSISLDSVIVGAYGQDGAGSMAGAAYVYERTWGGSDNWGQVQKIVGSDTQSGDLFGKSVSISGDAAVVGADGGYGNHGAAYIFYRDQGGSDNWGQVKRLTASDSRQDAYFGAAVAINEGTAVVGAFLMDAAQSHTGAAYIFDRDAGGTDTWGEVSKLTASDGQTNDFFGVSVSIHGNYAVVGAQYGDSAGTGAGAAYVYFRHLGGMDNWGQAARITASEGRDEDRFGHSVSICDDAAVVGAYYQDGAAADAGAAFIF